MRPVHVVGWADLRVRDAADEVEQVAPVVTAALEMAGLDRREVGFWCSGSCDYLLGRPFSFVSAVDGLGGWPPIRESHVEMDGAWALYEAWMRLQHGDLETALVYAFGRSTSGDPSAIAAQGLDPYTVAPLNPPADAIAGLQARAAGGLPVVALPPADGSAAVVLSTLGGGPRIDAIGHLAQVQELGARDLANPALPDTPTDVDRAELHLRYRHEAVVLQAALGLGDEVVVGSEDEATTMVDGLRSFVRAAAALRSGASRRALAHAQSGPCLQHNLLATLAAL